ncbi:hypothetical protein VNI00_012997 [Paramarasmius palmivorus]|uniref:Ricin B lectin domain-containing protein n=1 Tax=Paramarasmius palmivorus TaxID=297713 RepID=A0AAW0C1R5_9AGAR
MSIPTGRYLLTNVEFATVATLKEATPGQALVSKDSQNPGQDENNLWNVVILTNGNATIQNYHQTSYATTASSNPVVGDHVEGRPNQQQWDIIPVQGSSDTYTIATTFGGSPLVWGLLSAAAGSPVIPSLGSPTVHRN